MPATLSLAATHPRLAADWHPTLNYDLNPDDIDASYAEDVWWICSIGHPFRAQLSSRARYGTGCNVCTNKRVRPGVNDLATLDRALAAGWHSTRNTDLSPHLVSPGYKGEVWWQPSCGHYFPRSPLQRKADRRCQVCVDTRVFAGQNDFATLHPDLVGDLAPGQDLDLGQIRATDYLTSHEAAEQSGEQWLIPHQRRVE